MREFLKQCYLFNHFIIPTNKEDSKFKGVLKESYLNLFYSKMFKMMMPYFMRNIINLISKSVFNPVIVYANLAMYTMSSLLMTLYDGKKIISNAKLINSAWYKMAIKAYDKL